EAAKYARLRLNAVTATRDAIWLAGVVSAMRIQQTQRGRMMIITLDDGTAKLDVSLFDQMIDERRKSIVQDDFLMVFGRVSEDKFSGGFRVSADEVLNLGEARCHFADHLHFTLSGVHKAQALKALFAKHLSQNGLFVKADYANTHGKCVVDFGTQWRVMPTDACIQAFKTTFPDTQIIYPHRG
ncbi:MAG: hypothetical protein J5492_02805, partial [Oxalobacter sp.]|nr:hypothetical protein [Oxalobacter sp.]